MGTGARQQPGQDETKPETRRYLTAAEYFLRNCSFTDCRKYALRATESDPTHPGPTQILSIASVLSTPNISSTQKDCYTILNLPHFESDTARIESSFKTLSSILDPNVNPYPLSSEAFEVVSNAWNVLSNPVEKARFDDELRSMNHDGGGACGTSGNGGGTFWTMCPYCYYVYEYDKVYDDCCLRCANESCRRVLHAVAIGPPPPEIVEKGRYFCPGFMPLEIRCRNGEEIGEKLWVPFVHPKTKGSCDVKGGSNGGKGFTVNISDDDDDERAANISDVDEKSVARKLMRRGFNIDRNLTPYANGFEEDHTGGRDCKDSAFEGDDMMNDVEEIGVEFFEGDDDVLIGLQCDCDFGNEDHQ